MKKSGIIKASPTESGYLTFDKVTSNNTFYFVTYINEKFSVDALKESVKYVIKDIPKLSYKIKKGFWRDQWVPINDFCIDQIFETVEVEKEAFENDEEFLDQAFSKFVDCESKRINLEIEAPIKVKIFCNEKISKKILVYCVHHSFSDGMGTCQLIELIGKNYDAILHNKIPLRHENQSKIAGLFLSLHFKDIIYMFLSSFKTLLRPIMMALAKPLIEFKEKDNGLDEGSIERLLINTKELDKLKEKYKCYNFTFNDIILLLAINMMSKFNNNLKKPSRYLVASLSMNLRKYLSKDCLCICNYSGFDLLIINNKDSGEISKINKSIKDFKKKPLGIGFIMQLFMMNILPAKLQRGIIKSMMNSLAKKGGNYAIVTTNCGKLDKYVTHFGEGLEHISFIGAEVIYGFPSISASGYNDSMVLYFSKYKDGNQLCKVMKNTFLEMLNEILG